MKQFSVRVSPKVGCIDKVADTLFERGVHVESLACACEAGEGLATFSVSDKEPLKSLADIGAKETGIPVLHINVRNEAGCLSRVTSALSHAGVAVGSLACACSAADLTGTIAVGLLPHK